MADDTKDTQPESTTTPSGTAEPTRKRRVLRATPEPATLRERSEQAQAKSKEQHALSEPARIAARPFILVGRLLSKIFRPLGRFRIFKALGYIVVPPYFRNAFKELRLVTWPDARKTWRLTYAVVVFSLIFGLIVAGVDWGLDRLFREYILR